MKYTNENEYKQQPAPLHNETKPLAKVTDLDKKIHSNLEEAYALINKTKLNSSSSNSLENRVKTSNASIKPTLPTQLSSSSLVKSIIPPKSMASSSSDDNASSQSNNSGNQVRCDECTKVFYSKDFLALHKINKHSTKKATDHTQSGLILKNELLNFIKRETNAKALKDMASLSNGAENGADSNTQKIM